MSRRKGGPRSLPRQRPRVLGDNTDFLPDEAARLRQHHPELATVRVDEGGRTHVAGQVYNPDGSPMREGPDDWTRLCDAVVDAAQSHPRGHAYLGAILLRYVREECTIEAALHDVEDLKRRPA